MAYKKQLGKIGEEIAVRYLKTKGYRIIQTNFRCRLGEIDIIGEDGEYIVFVEVKTRTSLLYGYPIESISNKKKNSIVKVAQTYISFKNLKNKDLRFDVVEIIVDNSNLDGKKQVRLIKNAF